jgi:hypothetical protein
MSSLALLLVEVNDGYYTEFSVADLSADGLGVAMALGMRFWPAFDRAVDFRVQWFPSAAFRQHPGANFAEDYSGQTYLVAFKPRAITAIGESSSLLWGLQFINPVVGFEARGYHAAPGFAQREARRQTVFLGVTLDLQVVIDRVQEDQTSTTARVSRTIAHGLFEYFNLPFSTARVL